MTVASTLSKAGPYACDGVQTRFPFDFAVLDKKHIAVYINSALVVSGYSVELVEDQEGGTVVMAAPPRAGASLIILRDVPFTQWTDLQNRTAFYPEVLETAYDKLTMICQQLRELLSRVVIVPPGVEPSWEELMDLLTKAGAEAQEAADRAQDILDKILGMGLENMAPLDSPRFTGTPTAPTAGKGTSTDQIATTKFVQNEVADFLSPNQSSFVASQWILDQASSKYYHRIVTDARDISHVYKNEDGGFMVFDDTVEIHVVDEGYIKLVAAAGFDGHIVTLSKRLPVTYNYEPVTDGSGQIVSLTLTGVASNPGNITDLDIPSSAEYEGATYPVKKIGDSAFNGSRITSVSIGEGVEEIGYAAFMITKQLQSVTLPSSLRRIGSTAFYLSNLPAITLPDGLVQIDNSVFNATLLTTLHIPASVTAIYGSPAPSCLNLTEITVDPANPDYSAQDGVLYDKAKETLIQYPAGNTRSSFSVPEGVKVLRRKSMESALHLSSLTLPASLEQINSEALIGLKITALTISAGVQVIENSALSGMSALSEFSVAAENQFFSAQDGVLFDKNKTVLVQYPGGNSRTSYTVPDTVTEIASGAFRGIHNLATVTLPEGVQIIRTLAFYGSPAITGIDIPASVGTIESGAFGTLSNLTEITVAADNPSYSAQDGVLFDNAKETLIVYPIGNGETEYTVPASVRKISQAAFYNAKLTAVTFQDGLLQIDGNAFNRATSLTSLDFPASVNNIVNTAFYGCAELAEITFRNPGKWTMDNPFANCPKLFTVNGYPGSTAEDYAKRYNYLFKSLEEA